MNPFKYLLSGCRHCMFHITWDFYLLTIFWDASIRLRRRRARIVWVSIDRLLIEAPTVPEPCLTFEPDFAVQQGSEVASVGVVVEALDEAARTFYLHHEFVQLQDHPNQIFLAMATIERAFKARGIDQPASSSRSIPQPTREPT